MTAIWVESLGRSFDAALDLLATAIRDCPDDLWNTSMWAVPADLFGPAPPGPDGKPVTDAAARQALAQRRSTPWSVAWHALEVLHYDLTGEFEPWEPPPPFAGHPHWLLTRLPEPWTRSEMLGYLDYCRERVRATLAGMTDETAAAALPAAHRYSGQPHAWIITSALGHTVEHAAQIRQCITTAELASPDPGSG
jgi:hypothetical protein